MNEDFRLYIPFDLSKANKDQKLVYGYASTEALDSQGEIVKKEAIEEALPDYMKFANIREMHQHSAVGKTVSATIDETGLFIGGKIVDTNAWEKVKEGVYNGFSIGGKIVEKVGNEVKRLKLSEISIVDRPANPEAVFTMVKRNSKGVLEDMQKRIEEKNGKFCVVSHTTGKNMGCYATKPEAEKRLAQIKQFSEKIEAAKEAIETDLEKNFGMARHLATIGSALEEFMRYCESCDISIKNFEKALGLLKQAFTEIVLYEMPEPEVNGQDGPMMMIELMNKLSVIKFGDEKADAIRKEVIRMANKDKKEEVVEETVVAETTEESKDETVEESVETTAVEAVEATEETPASDTETAEEGTPEAGSEEKTAEPEADTPSDSVVVDEAVQTADQPSDVTKAFTAIAKQLDAIIAEIRTAREVKKDDTEVVVETATEEVKEETTNGETQPEVSTEASPDETSTNTDEAAEGDDVAKVEETLSKVEESIAKALNPLKEELSKIGDRLKKVEDTPAQVKVKSPIAVEKGFAEGTETKTPDESRLDEVSKRLGELSKMRDANLDDYQIGNFQLEAIELQKEQAVLKSRLGI